MKINRPEKGLCGLELPIKNLPRKGCGDSAISCLKDLRAKERPMMRALWHLGLCWIIKRRTQGLMSERVLNF